MPFFFFFFLLHFFGSASLYSAVTSKGRERERERRDGENGAKKEKKKKDGEIDGESWRAEAGSGDSAFPSGSRSRGAVGSSPPKFY